MSLFVCGEHARRGDSAIGDGTLIRLVTMSCDLVFAGSSIARTDVIDDAFGRVQLAALAAGAGLTVHGVTSTLSRYYRAAHAIGRPGARG